MFPHPNTAGILLRAILSWRTVDVVNSFIDYVMHEQSNLKWQSIPVSISRPLTNKVAINFCEKKTCDMLT